jgi:hypothetical protein
MAALARSQPVIPPDFHPEALIHSLQAERCLNTVRGVT